MSVELGTVTNAPPDLKIKVDNMKVDLDRDDLVVAQYLTKHKRQVKIDGVTTVELEFQDELKPGDRVIVASTRNVTGLPLRQARRFFFYFFYCI
ncbi:DUF2577 family protein [Geobacillus vulcani]|uniref:DUF2577 family protein n=1 Tax=Geobacillus vulcani TaxID=135517 RepID=UPI00053B1911|nr:DUF2577 family protein [Geobacillus vulcani]